MEKPQAHPELPFEDSALWNVVSDGLEAFDFDVEPFVIVKAGYLRLMIDRGKDPFAYVQMLKNAAYLEVATIEHQDIIEQFNRRLEDFRTGAAGRAHLESSLAEKRISIGFLRAWGELCALSNSYWFIREIEKKLEGRFVKQVNSAKRTDISNQKIWIARWIVTNYSDVLHGSRFRESDLDDAKNEIAELCWEISSEKILCPDPFKKDWFERVLADRKAGGLVTRIDRLGRKAILDLAATPWIPSALLPSVDPADFRRASTHL